MFGYHHHDYDEKPLEEIIREQHEILQQAREQTRILEEIYERGIKPTPIQIIFKEITMNPEGPNVTQVWQGSILPAGSAFPTGTTFTAVPSDSTVTVTVDSTGLNVTIAYPATFEPNPSNPFSVAWSTSTFVPSPSTSPAQLTATITPTAPAPAVATPTGVSFSQIS